jgi:hypothetical protein
LEELLEDPADGEVSPPPLGNAASVARTGATSESSAPEFAALAVSVSDVASTV